jgi:DNA-directed RNA polymerase subunit E'/Rpb7
MESVAQPEIMETKTSLPQQKLYKKKEIKYSGIYSRSLITRSVVLPIVTIGKNIKETIEKCIAVNFEGKCIVEGFVKPNSSKIITYSSGVVQGTNIKFEVVFECQICCPVEGMLIPCIAKNITKAGIRAESDEELPSPIVVFIMRDHSYMSKYFSSINENDKIMVRVIGQRFELNDKYVSIIGEAVDSKKDFQSGPRKTGVKKISNNKPKLVIE